jgi:hypothetical protein
MADRSLAISKRNTRPIAERRDEPAKIALQMVTGATGFLLLGAALMVARGARWTFTAMDGVYWALAGAFVGLRYAEMRRASSAGEARADAQGWARFLRYFALGAVAVWVIAHSVQGRL